jgi:hypothetical protein
MKKEDASADRRLANRESLVAGVAILSLMLAYFVSLFFRWPAFTNEIAPENLEASYHVLWTIKAITSSPVASHGLLPTVTLAPFAGNDISWGATVPTDGGSYIYTSFPPLGFLMPMLMLDAISIEVTFKSLAILNTMFGLVAAVGIGMLASSVVRYSTARHVPGRPTIATSSFQWLVFALAAISYLWLPEAMRSHGVVYWSQSLSQIVFIFASLLAFRLFIQDTPVYEKAVFLVLLATFPLLEWTGYVFNVGVMAAWVLYSWTRLPSSARTVSKLWPLLFRNGWARGIMFVTACAGLITLIHFSAWIDVSEFLSKLHGRAEARSHGTNSIALIGQMPAKYWASFGVVIPIAAALLAFSACRGALRNHSGVMFLLVITGFVMLENVLMLQHAMQFSFDRLKFAVFLIVVVFFSMAFVATRQRQSFLLSIFAIVMVSNLAISLQQQKAGDFWVDVNEDNRDLVEALKVLPEAMCGIYGSNEKVRGYLNLLFERDIYEHTNLQSLAGYTEESGSCGLVFIETVHVAPDLPKIVSLEVYNKNGEVRKIHRDSATVE